MSLRRYVSLMHGIGYSAVPESARPRGADLSSTSEVYRFFGGAVRRSGVKRG